MKPIFYIAVPYTHPNPNISDLRFRMVTEFCARQSRLGVVVFSPITHSHELAKYGTPSVWEFWKQIDVEFLRRSSFLIILMLDGWRDSVGVQAEIKLAQDLDVPFMYLNYDENIPTQFNDEEKEKYFFKVEG